MLRPFVLVMVASITAACDGESGSAGSGASPASGPAPDIQADWILLGIGDPVPGGPPPGSFQDALDGWTYVFQGEAPDDPAAQYLCQHDAAQMDEKLREGNWSDEIVCAPPEGDPPTSDQPHTGDPGTNMPPTGYKTWFGGGANGGCGIWASLMCDRILGEKPWDQPVTQAEWEQTAVEVGADPTNGGAVVKNVRQRYEALGYCTTEFDFRGGPNDFGRLDFYKNQQCDVKLAMWRRDETGKLSNGHIEMVTRVTANSAETNSWGMIGTITGGSKGDFRFRRGELDAVDKRGDLAYEPDATTVHAIVVCPCGVFESLGVKPLGGG